MQHRGMTGGRRSGLALLALASLSAAALLGEMLAAPAAQAAEATIPEPDGLSAETAAASCWEIKQLDSDAESGIYWISTPALGGAEQFYCDQEREGGGWVLIGRGREAWSVSSIGSGTPAQVRDAVTGTAAFTPRQLSSELIGKLVNGERIDSLDDGIRLVRAQNAAGTQWHDMTFKFSSPRADWSWQFNNEQRVGTYRIGGQNFSGGTTANFGRNNNYDRVRTITGSNEGWHMGFGFGSNIRGTNTSSTYLWSKDASTGYARPFTQVFLRPKLMSDDVYSAIPESGTEAATGPAVASGFALPQSWGVAGLGAGPASIEGSNEVSAFAESNGRVFVGGNFTAAQRSAGGSGAQQQAYLAAFDQSTGAFVSTFRPSFNNQVKAIVAMPGGRIAVGGYFTQVNGQARAGLVVLDAQTGEIDPAFTGRLLNYLSGGAVVVRSLDVQDGWLYAGGTFTHSTGGTESREVYTRSAARFAVSDGTAQQPWNPEFNGTVVSLDASDHGDRVYFAGYFTESKGRTAMKGAALSATSEQLFPWNVLISSTERSGYQQAVLEVGDRVWLGGSEHSLFSYSRSNLSLMSTTIGKAGGDFQAIASDGEAVYGGCHCFETQYEGARNWPNVGNSWTAANAIDSTGAWSAASGEAIPVFNGNYNTRNGAGAWALFVDSEGTLWQGGDFTYSVAEGYQRQWSGGFIRHAQRDAAAPSKPSGLQAAADPEGVTLSWSAADDNRGVTAYEVLRNDRVVATVTAGTTARLSPSPADTRYFVRAIDEQGNRSASTSAAVAEETPEPPESDVLIAAGSTWSYLYGSTAPAGDWTAVEFDDSGWSTGAAPFGWGYPNLGTVLDAPAPKPIVSMYRKTFELASDSAVEEVQITTRADDGLVLFVNGTEVERVRVDDGPFGVGTYANTAVNATYVQANPVTVTVPRDVLVAGTNIVTASVHSNYRSTPSHSFELEAVATLGEGGEPLPEPPEEPEEPEPPQLETIVESGSTWAYQYGGTAPDDDWTVAGFDDADWETGEAPLGWGYPNLGTTLDAPSPKPIVSLHRMTFELEPGTAFEEVEITTRADDGLVLFVNGTEVERVRVDDGPFGMGTYANAAVNASYVQANPVTVTVPADLFVAGTNVIAASVHSNYRATPSHSFELEAVATLGGDPLEAEALQQEEPEEAAGDALSDAPTERREQAPAEEPKVSSDAPASAEEPDDDAKKPAPDPTEDAAAESDEAAKVEEPLAE